MKEIGSIDLRVAVPGLLAVILAAMAYQLLLDYSPTGSLESQAETLMFNNTSSGPPVVLVLTAWLSYRRWPRLRRLSTANASPLLAALLFAPCPPIFAWSIYTGSPDLLVVALMSNALAAAALFWGSPGLRVVWLPVVFLLFAIHAPAPLINQVLWKFQIWTANYTGALLHALNLSAFVTGDQVIRPDQNYAIIETCSGLRSLESLSMLTVLMIDLFRRTGLHAVILIVMAPFVAFAVNGLRALTIILNPHSEVVEIHTLQGVSVLMVGLLMLYFFDGWLERFLPARFSASGEPSKRPAAPSGPDSAGASNVSLSSKTTAKMSPIAPIIAVVMSALLLGLAEWTPVWQAPGPIDRPFPSSLIPKNLEGWSSSRVKLDRQFMGIVGFRAYVDRRYERGDDAIRLFAGVGGHEKPRVSPFSPKTALPGSGWWIEGTDSIVIEPDSRPVRARVVRYGLGARRKLVLDWTEGTKGLLDEVVRAAAAIDKSAWHRPREGVSIRISTRLRDLSEAERAAAQERLLEFYRTFRPHFDRLGVPRGK